MSPHDPTIASSPGERMEYWNDSRAAHWRTQRSR